MSLAAAIAIPAAARANGSFSFTRLGGTDRYDTARLVAEAAFPSGASTVLLANGSLTHFPDALTGSYLAGFLKAPVLLTDASALPAATNRTLQELHTNTIVVLGGTAAVSQSQYDQLAAHYKMARVSGPTRYDTMKAVAEGPPAGAVGRTADGATAILASGTNFPDALVSGPVGYARAFPVLITDPASLSAQTGQTLKDLGIQFVLIPGGTAAVSASVESQVNAMGIGTQRFAGTDRTDTAAQVATYAVQSLGFTNTKADLARGDDPADSLSGGPYGGVNLTPTLLTENQTTLGTASGQYLMANAPTLASGAIFGGTGAVSQAVQDEATKDAQTASAVPKLSSASLSGKTLVLSYTQAVLCSTVDANGSDYQVNADTTADNPTAAACSNPSAQGTSGTVVLTLPTAPAGNQSVTVTAQKGADGNTVTDSAGDAELVGDSTSTSTTLTPGFANASATAGLTTVVVGYTEPIVCSSVQPSDFSVAAGSTADAVSAASCSTPSAQSVSLTVATAPTSGQTVTVTAQKGSDGDTVADQSGQTQLVGDSVSTTASSTATPSLLAIAAGGASTTVTITYDEAITCSSLDSNGSDYTLTDTAPGGTAAADNPTAAACFSPSNGVSNTARLTVPTAPQTGDSLTITAENGSDANTVVDPGGGKEAVGDSITAIAQGPQFTGLSATAGSTSVILTYNEQLTCTSVDPGDYNVMDNSSPDPLVSPPTCSGNHVTLTAASAPKGGDTVKVTAAKGLDQDTVIGVDGYAQKPGDSTSGTLPVPPATAGPAFSGSSSQVGNPNVIVTYNEPIKCSTVNAADYTATLDSNPDLVTNAACVQQAGTTPTSSQFVTITLGQAPSSTTKTVTIGVAPTSSLTDNNGNKQSSSDTTSSTPSAAPAGPAFLGSSSQVGNQKVSVDYNEPVKCSTVNPADYTAMLDSNPDPVTGAACDQQGTTAPTSSQFVTVTLGQAPSATTKTVTIGVAPTSSLTDNNGNKQSSSDTTSSTPAAASPAPAGPAFSGSTSQVGDPNVFVSYDEPVQCSTVNAADYTAMLDSTPDLVANAACVKQSGSTPVSSQLVTITLGQAPSSTTKTVTIGVAPTSSLTDNNGNKQSSSDTTSSKPSPAPTGPAFLGSSSQVGNPKVSVDYNEAVTCSTVNAADYTAMLDSNPDPVTGAACDQQGTTTPTSSQSVTVTLGQAPSTTTKAVTIGVAPTSSLTDNNGNKQSSSDTTSSKPSASLAPRFTGVAWHNTGAPPTPDNPNPVSTMANAYAVLTYNESISCASVDADGSDYTITYTNGVDSGTKGNGTYHAYCYNSSTGQYQPGGSSNQVLITFTTPGQPGYTVTFTVNNPSPSATPHPTDGNTVLSASDATASQPSGDTVSVQS